MTLSITMLGLGPGRWADLTLEAHEALAQAARQQPVYFRTLSIQPLTTSGANCPISA